jgi:hypothetical protein
VNRFAGAAACVILTLSSAAAEAKPKIQPTRLAGIVLKSSSKISPGADGPVFREGRLTMADKADRSEELKANPKTKVTLDGKPSTFKAATPGTLIVRALYDPNTKVLTVLDLKSVPREPSPAAEQPGTVTGEVANTDVLKGTVSVRLGPQSNREYAVSEQTTVVGPDGKALSFEAIKIGDAVEVESKDGKSASVVRIRLAP